MASLSQSLRVTSSILASSARAWGGTNAFAPARKQPEQPLVLYEFEACPYCRLLREALTEMDLDAEIRPCPKGGQRYRPQVVSAGGKAQFPYLQDPNTGTALYESADIIAYLAKTYAAKAPRRTPQFLRLAGSELASLLRGMRGFRARPSRAPAQPLILYSFESSPFSRLVRERLCELELPYILKNTGKAEWKDMGPPQVRDKLSPNAPQVGRNRKALHTRAGKVQLPYLIDPNTGEEMFESAAIIEYLERQYAA